MSKEDMISTFLKTLGPTYQLMLLIASHENFTEVVDKDTCVKLVIREGLVQDAPHASASTTRSVPKKATIIKLEVSTI